MFNPFTLIVNSFNQQEFEINCFGYQHTVEYIKFVLSEQTGLERNQIQLVMGEQQLENEKTFEDYGIWEESRIWFWPTLKTSKN